MKTLGFQTFLFNPEAEPRGIQLIKNQIINKLCKILFFLYQNYVSLKRIVKKMLQDEDC
jgi:hypothetical protein